MKSVNTMLMQLILERYDSNFAQGRSKKNSNCNFPPHSSPKFNRISRVLHN